MSAQDFSNWIPVEYDANVSQRPDVLSAIERHATGVPMGTNAKIHPRSAAATVTTMAKSSAFSEDSGVNDKVTLTAVKIGLAFRIAQEDLNDSIVDIVKTKQAEFARSYAKVLDNACLGTTAASNGTTVPFTSLYKALLTADANTGYSASANYLASATSGGVTYDNLNSLMALAEASDWYDPNNQIVIAHPKLKQILRGLKDSQGHPIFVPGVYGQGGTGTPDTLFGLDITYSLGAKTSATATQNPAGNPLIFTVNPAYLLRGDRSGVEAAVDSSAAILTDETLLVIRARKAFVTAIPNAAAVLEVLS